MLFQFNKFSEKYSRVCPVWYANRLVHVYVDFNSNNKPTRVQLALASIALHSRIRTTEDDNLIDNNSQCSVNETAQHQRPRNVCMESKCLNSLASIKLYLYAVCVFTFRPDCLKKNEKKQKQKKINMYQTISQ